ncbi:hypothetical protein TBLA_0F02040 [Henningerozyma blattae CBS 6284]|uniref:Uncharacterized protein n=1 Tax=Henningerozyma blattae (strain ATCC 34711 / CBS 6284 / DSM 70876 / NBRC 10599 / NRRL Y-10934 / UCD 77-7) TaxID=1071380 RepID=I2H5U4_HENB6|nr:hypothetical protein TBLA_0F02040 [Tetrapisispora blattae CBS 6284]CCH61746.1 hypothetical protein TBLA_0F02040 [Tetrapisispora blattae CBS 6284]
MNFEVKGSNSKQPRPDRPNNNTNTAPTNTNRNATFRSPTYHNASASETETDIEIESAGDDTDEDDIRNMDTFANTNRNAMSNVRTTLTSIHDQDNVAGGNHNDNNTNDNNAINNNHTNILSDDEVEGDGDADGDNDEADTTPIAYVASGNANTNELDLLAPVNSHSISHIRRLSDPFHNKYSTNAININNNNKKPNYINMTGNIQHHEKINNYTIYPTTVPPFALTKEFIQTKQINEKYVDRNITRNQLKNKECNTDKFKDPFLHIPEVQWGKYIENIGSNMTYSNEKRRNSVNLLAYENGDIDSIDLEKQQSFYQYQHNFKLKDLSDEWGGAKRLNQLFDNVIMLGGSKNELTFKTAKDRKDWNNYVANVIDYNYNNNNAPNAADINLERRQSMISRLTTMSGDLDLEADGASISRTSTSNSNMTGRSGWGLGRSRGHDGGVKSKTKWLEEINKDREKWDKLKNKKIKIWKPKLIKLLIDSQYTPLAVRIMTWIFVIVCLGLSTRIYANVHNSDRPIHQRASTILSIIVSTVSVVYLILIARDEFSSKPLGLRNPLMKLRLILLDLLFIIFFSATLSLTFETMTDNRWVCKGHDEEIGKMPSTCRKQKALASFELITLVMWMLSFSISILRIVVKVSSNLGSHSNEDEGQQYIPLISSTHR